MPEPELLAELYSDSRYHNGGFSGFGYEKGPLSILGEHERTLLCPPAPGAFLDIGSGAGDAVIFAHSRGWRTTAVDYDIPEPKIPGITYEAGDPLRLLCEMHGKVFQLIFMLQVLEHVVNPLDLLRVIRPLLAPTGRLLVTTPNGSSLGHRKLGGNASFKQSREHLFYFTEDGIRKLVGQAGMSIARITTRGGLGLGTGPYPAESELRNVADAIEPKNDLRSRAIARIPSQLRSELIVEITGDSQAAPRMVTNHNAT